jgi:methylmalonyl-CoA/ethylmalonyl-CoA epimerase
MIEDLCVQWQEGKINQICEVSWDLDKTIERYWNYFGFGPWYIWDFLPPDLHSYYYKGARVEAGFRIALAQIGPIQYEITQPLFGLGIHRDFLEKKGEGVHHLKMYFEDIPKTKEMFAKMGIYVLQEARYKEEDWHVFFDTEKQFGVIWEIGNCKDIGDPWRVYPVKK